MNSNIISEFVTEVLTESDIAHEESTTYARLHNSYVDRVTARVFLEAIKILTPEQAALVRAEMDSESPNPEKLFAKMAEQIPDLASLLIKILAGIRTELLAELKK